MQAFFIMCAELCHKNLPSDNGHVNLIHSVMNSSDNAGITATDDND